MKEGSFNNNLFEGKKGKVFLELSKTYKGDSRFKLDSRFEDDIDVGKLPQKFREMTDDGLISKLEKNKKIKKDKPLMIQRFEPGTAFAQALVKKAEGQKKFEQSQKRHLEKLERKRQQQHHIEKGINKVKKGQKALIAEDQEQKIVQVRNKFKITINGNRKQAFKQTEFKLFG